ncbi:hypothetical protein CROQUDRAFT_41198, partial [Cronartium quercuum f. sp. fusiforme G11]
QFEGKEWTPTVILEAIAPKNLRACFLCAGSFNEINVMNMSPLFDNFLNVIPQTNPETDNWLVLEIMGHIHHQGYYLAYAIYLPWPALVEISQGEDEARKLFAKLKEAS